MSHRHWCFTLNNHFLDDIENICLFVNDDIARYVCFGEEISETGTPHLQGYIEFHKPHRLRAVKRLFNDEEMFPHLEERRGTRDEARDYCLKTGQYHEAGSWCTGQGQRTDLATFNTLITMIKDGRTDAELVEFSPATFTKHYRGLDRIRGIFEKQNSKQFRTVTVNTVIGKAGSGKTRAAFEFDNDTFVVDCSNEQFPFNGYDGENTILLDDFRGGIKYAHLLRILDGHRLLVNVKGGCRYAQWENVIITSNAEPSTWYKFGLTPELSRRLKTGTHSVIPESVQSVDELSLIPPEQVPTDPTCDTSHKHSPVDKIVDWLVERFKDAGNTTSPPWLPQAVDMEVPTPHLIHSTRPDNVRTPCSAYADHEIEHLLQDFLSLEETFVGS